MSVVLPTYNEVGSLRWAAESFWATEVVDELIVVNNNAARGTSEALVGTRAREIFERRQGYGNALRTGLRSATGDYLICAEPDGTFLGEDVFKLLAYADEFDIVYGTRTSWDSIWEGANMGPFLRWGNWAVAKLVEALYAAPCLTDVGCTMRLLTREALERLNADQFEGGSTFGLEMLLASLVANLRIVQIPLNYLPRVGESAVTGSKLRAFWLGLRMIQLTLTYRRRHPKRRPPGPRARLPAAARHAVPPHSLRERRSGADQRSM